MRSSVYSSMYASGRSSLPIRARLGALALLIASAAGAGCGDNNAPAAPDAALAPDAGPSPDAAPVPDAAPMSPDAAPMPDGGTGMPLACDPPPSGPQNPAAPAVEIAFPPQRSLTDTDTIHIRGRATHTDAIASITVNGVPATSTDGFAEWSAIVPLDDGQNIIIVESADASGNVDPTAANVCVVLSRNIMERTEYITLDEAGGRALVLDRELATILAVDLATGARTEVSGPNVGSGPSLDWLPLGLDYDPATGLAYTIANGEVLQVDVATGDRTSLMPGGPGLGSGIGNLAFDAANDRVLLTRVFSDSVTAVDITTGQVSVLSDGTTGGPPLDFPWDIAIDAANNRALVTQQNPFELISVSLTSGARTMISGPAVGSGPDIPGSYPAIALDLANGRAFAGTGSRPEVYAIDLATGARTVIADDTTGSGPLTSSIWGLIYDPGTTRAVAIDRIWDVVWSVDVTTGQRSFLSHAFVGTGERLNRPASIAFDEPRDALYITENSSPSRITLMDLPTGDRSTASPDGNGLGSLTMAPGGNSILMINRNTQAIVSFDPATATFTDLASSTLGSGPDMEFVSSIAVDETSGGVLLLAIECFGEFGPCYGRVLSVDTATGNRFLISDDGLGNGPRLTWSNKIVHDSARDRALVLDRDVDDESCAPEPTSVRTVDLVTGDRSTLAGAGPALTNGADMLLDPTRDRLLVLWSQSCFNWSYSYNSGLTSVDLTTGERVILSGAGVGGGPRLLLGAELAMNESGDYALVSDYSRAAVAAVDLVTGYRVIISY